MTDRYLKLSSLDRTDASSFITLSCFNIGTVSNACKLSVFYTS